MDILNVDQIILNNMEENWLTWIIDYKKNEIIDNIRFSGITKDDAVNKARKYIEENNLHDKSNHLKIMVKDNRNIDYGPIYFNWVIEDTTAPLLGNGPITEKYLTNF